VIFLTCKILAILKKFTKFLYGNPPLAAKQMFVYNENMIEEELAEALNNLKLERIGEHSMRGKIITGWTIKITLNRCEINLGEVNAFLKVKGLLEGEDKEEALESAESFVKPIYARNPEKLKKMIEKNKKEN